VDVSLGAGILWGAFRGQAGVIMSKLLQFFREAYEELRRVTWLTRPQMIASTWLVILMVLAMSAYVFLVDKVISIVFSLLI
jgi:preprotein translocase SecE subunit